MAEPTTIRTKRITELLPSTPILGDEVFPILQEGTTKKIDMFGVNDYIKSQDYVTWVFSNSSSEMQATSVVNSISAESITANTWVFVNSAIEKQATDLVLLSSVNWGSAYNFSLGIATNKIGNILMGDNSISNSNILAGAVSPSKLSTGAPTWSTGIFTINSNEVHINPTINADSSILLNDNNFNKNSNIIHTGTGKLNITSESLNGDINIQTINDADIIFKTNNITRGSIDGETGVAIFNYGIQIPAGYKVTAPTIEATNLVVTNQISLANSPVDSLKIKSGGALDFLNSSQNQSFSISLTGSQFNRLSIFNRNNNQSAFYIDEINNIGIGNTSPKTKLDVSGDITLGVGTSIYRSTPTGSAALTLNGASTMVRLVADDTTGCFNQYVNAYNDNVGNKFISINSSPATKFTQCNGTFSFRVSPNGVYPNLITWTNGLFISNSGSVGIGTESPESKLHVTSDIKTNGYLFLDNNFSIRQKDSSSNYRDLLWLNNANITYLQGNNIYFRTLAGANLGHFDATGNLTTVGDVAAFSDEKLKKNVKTIDNALDKVKQLRGVEYERKDIDKKGLGFIAQEVEKVLPELVSQHDDFKTVSYANVVSVLVEAIKELSNEIEILKNKIP
jgi:hypothetical protein